GRRTAMFEGGPDGTKIAEWTYDTLKKGLPTASTRFVDGHAYTTKVASYDEQNRVTSEQVVIPEVEDELARTYTFRTRYFPNSDLVEAYSMPAAGVWIPRRSATSTTNWVYRPRPTAGTPTPRSTCTRRMGRRCG